MYKILVTGRNFGSVSKTDYNYFLDRGYEILPNICAGRLPSEQELCDMVADADAILIGNDMISTRVLEHAEHLKVIAKSGIGVDNIDIPAATAKGIAVTNVPGTTANSVAELTMGFILCISKLIMYTNRRVMKGMWPLDRGSDISGKALGIVGFGRIGQTVAKFANAFSMKIMAYDPYFSEEAAKKLGVKKATLDEITKQCDFITLHIPKTSETTNLFDAERIARMKQGSFLINAARGGIVNEDALYNALQSGHLAGAAADVLEHEPPTERPRLYDCENFLITSHSGGNSKETIMLTSKVAAQNIIEVLEGLECPNVVNSKELAKR
ncbi:MAG: phosphoglycerate dehydrogenase [Negativicutes bacterium]